MNVPVVNLNLKYRGSSIGRVDGISYFKCQRGVWFGVIRPVKTITEFVLIDIFPYEY